MSHGPHQDPLLSLTILFYRRITLTRCIHQLALWGAIPNSPQTHRLLFALKFQLSLPPVLFHFHLCLFLCLLQTPGLPWKQKKDGAASPMASTARRRRRERRFRRYLSAGRLARAQALLQRHPGLDVDAGRPPPLHRACARHDAPALCLLLRLGADPARPDRHGNTALHAAARRGPGAYTDFFLPLLRRCPSAMGMKNKDGETPGQILGWGPPWDSAEEEEDDEASREHQWRQKLLGELEDEWQEATGRLEERRSLSTSPCHQGGRETPGSTRPAVCTHGSLRLNSSSPSSLPRCLVPEAHSPSAMLFCGLPGAPVMDLSHLLSCPSYFPVFHSGF
ncbi:NF-kappa-B inhibitor-like protein 1 isoform X4 [Myotis lucifugus]|uniref:NF-kappa-B inhibitor-like protein 1 isoform X4 n=1 Tax=Myotis lucifugus TaxID=59463 RepID=UPI000CCBF213|nr:NF-kappa-B inhibitor-like protein 1 isoform X4 [Myotis lucifugus]